MFGSMNMDLFDIFLNSGLITGAIVIYLIFFKRSASKEGKYREPGWNYPLKYVFARYYAVKYWKSKIRSRPISDLPHADQVEGWDGISLRCTSTDGQAVILEIRKLCSLQPLAEVSVCIKMSNGTSYTLPRHPDTLIGTWVNLKDGWSAGGLKIQVLVPETSLRILYNGLLTSNSGVTQHAKLNLIWTTASEVMQYPKDWSDQLAAEALALEPWRDGNWTSLLSKWKEGSWMQWGAAQGRLQLFNADGSLGPSEYLRTRGARERRWMPRSAHLHRQVALTASTAEGTAIQFRGLSYKNVLTQSVHGVVRLPDTTVKAITAINLNIPDFCEIPEALPSAFTINVRIPGRDMRVVIRCNSDGGKLMSGVPYQQETIYHTVHVQIDGHFGTGLLELGYPSQAKTSPSVALSPAPVLWWLTEEEAGPVGYCVTFEDRAAACPNYVGGKGASLALLASVQLAEGYRVPPGFCLTIKALERHLAMNPALLNAIKDIEAANEDYSESVFKAKCAKAVDLFSATAISGELLDDILAYLNELRKKANKEDFGLERRFAVRSSAVGEDSEVLSAAGQNETILGCLSDADVIKGVQKCWGSMFAFTSAYYRRQNGQQCLCGGGVVIQALVQPQVAGVMFTRHPDAGDPSRLLITANYGLGESVVSGAIEPDTVVVTRSMDGRLDISKIDLGTKTKKVMAVEDGVAMEDVPETERLVACLDDSQILRLAQLGVAQEQLWGAGRDIEWAICKNEIFLVQARPITSLERWSEEELLHELDTPIMADDELTTFANCGEVFPKPITAMSRDLVVAPMTDAIKLSVSKDTGRFEESIFLSHNRFTLALYNTVYRRVPHEVDVNIRMIEMAIHGHKVANDDIIRTAINRHPPKITDKLQNIIFIFKAIFMPKWHMNNTIKKVKAMNIETNTDNITQYFDSICKAEQVIEEVAFNHGFTSAASTCAQFIAMTVLLEGASDFSSEHCSDIAQLLSAGDVLSAEVPQCLAKLAKDIEEAGKADQFREIDPNVAMEWLKENLPKVYSDLQVFLEQHGHRAIMEFDMLTKPWAMVPEELMKVLQTLKGKHETLPTKSDAQIINSLTTPKKSSTRKILAWVLPLCRRTVRYRETTKANVILAIHKMRLATIDLGKILVRQWYLPHHDLIFFFRVLELKKYITTRDPALLRKAIQRQQYYSNWCKLKFAENNTGWVQPLESKAPQVVAGEVRMEATSICSGEIVARACVVKYLSEIHQLQQGDILITNATDIGWSPYFPLLSGIVTELGGLISHGAVIAREYGLPCIVGATHATELFQTGDMVRLSGTKGFIEKVEVAEPLENDTK